MPDFDPNDIGNATIRMGYLTAAIGGGSFREYLIQRGATAQQCDDAVQALVMLANVAFYQNQG